VVSEDESQNGTGLTWGRRILRIKTGFLPVLMGKGIHYYSVFKDALPEDCRILDCSLNFRSIHDADELVLLLESSDWEPIDGVPAPEVRPDFVKHHCP
jgi:hypothetical protein